jgi:hypothetical protein
LWAKIFPYKIIKVIPGVNVTKIKVLLPKNWKQDGPFWLKFWQTNDDINAFFKKNGNLVP